ncbi:hypothetical protein CDAR_37871 [Caerostris darwini]|uniref:Uncharacterized protein n=1 Tax=Caerostris darwini TaxID=1538125 RepID=A0AAV4T4Q2_9ARAC|nr:hypothetical protein CDAR_37871 [Caerostris darwini]
MHRIALSTMGVEACFAILVFLEFLGGIVCGAQIGPVYRAVCGQPSVKAAAQFPKWPWIAGGKNSIEAHQSYGNCRTRRTLDAAASVAAVKRKDIVSEIHNLFSPLLKYPKLRRLENSEKSDTK